MNDAAATERSSLRLRQQLRLLALAPKKRRKMQAPDGSAWAPVKSKRKPVHIKRMARRLKSKADTNNATLFFVGSHACVVPPRNHFGDQEPGRAPRRKSERVRTSEKGEKKAPFTEMTLPLCTRRQAIELHELGYAVLSQRGKRRRYRKPSVKWIQEHLGMAKAGVLLRVMRDAQTKKSWTIKTPARPLLPKSSDPSLIVLVNKAIEDILWAH